VEPAGVELAGAEEAGAALDVAGAALEPPGTEMVMGTPAPAQVPSTAVMTAAWSEGEQADWTQGRILGTRSVFLQWQAKSVRLEQPSVVKAVTKHDRAQLGMLSSWAVATEANAAKAIAENEIFILKCS